MFEHQANHHQREVFNHAVAVDSADRSRRRRPGLSQIEVCLRSEGNICANPSWDADLATTDGDLGLPALSAHSAGEATTADRLMEQVQCVANDDARNLPHEWVHSAILTTCRCRDKMPVSWSEPIGAPDLGATRTGTRGWPPTGSERSWVAWRTAEGSAPYRPFGPQDWGRLRPSSVGLTCAPYAERQQVAFKRLGQFAAGTVTPRKCGFSEPAISQDHSKAPVDGRESGLEMVPDLTKNRPGSLGCRSARSLRHRPFDVAPPLLRYLASSVRRCLDGVLHCVLLIRPRLLSSVANVAPESHWITTQRNGRRLEPHTWPGPQVEHFEKDAWSMGR
jgi:hypothetical protein